MLTQQLRRPEAFCALRGLKRLCTMTRCFGVSSFVASHDNSGGKGHEIRAQVAADLAGVLRPISGYSADAFHNRKQIPVGVCRTLVWNALWSHMLSTVRRGRTTVPKAWISSAKDHCGAVGEGAKFPCRQKQAPRA